MTTIKTHNNNAIVNLVFAFATDTGELIVDHISVTETDKPVALITRRNNATNFKLISKYACLGDMVQLRHILRDDYGFAANHIEIKKDLDCCLTTYKWLTLGC